jgi:hypothetical protein
MDMKPASALLISMLMAGCGNGSGEVGPGGVSPEDARALDEAAAKLDAETEGQPRDIGEPRN